MAEHNSNPVMHLKSEVIFWITRAKVNSIALLLILILAGSLRLINIGAVGFNSDEAVYSGQAASIAQDSALTEFFPIFRAHPLLHQFMLSVVFTFSVSDVLGRVVSAFFGICTVLLVYMIGSRLYKPKVGIFSALFLAIMPYHVIVTRQVLLDGPMTFFATLTAYLLVRYATSQSRPWLYAAGASMGLTFLAKETGILLLAAIYAFLALAPSVRVRIGDLVLSMVIMLLVIVPFPLTLAIAGGGGSETTQQYLVWQLFRRPNHEWAFYPTTVTEVIGPLLILLALYGLIVYRKNNSWREVLLLSWIVVPAIFFQAWPVKGFHYLLIIAPPISILAARTVGDWSFNGIVKKGAGAQRRVWLRTLYVGALIISLFIASWIRIQPHKKGQFLAGSGGVPGGREAGLWLKTNSPVGSTLMTIGPSMANILQFYGYRQAYGLSVSPNPLHRNPSYTPIRNPDFEIRTGEFQYLVWDAYSASRSSFFSEKLIDLAERYNGRIVHTESVLMTSENGMSIEKPVIVIYEVRP